MAQQVPPVLEVSNLSKTYWRGQNKVEAVRDLSFAGFPGEILGILGPNGSGKTTTIKSIATIVDFEVGTIRVAGHNNQSSRLKVLANLGAVLEGARNIYWTLTPEENAIYFAGLHGLSKKNIQPLLDDMFSSLDLDKYRGRQVGELSKGNQQKVAVCCALIANPRVVLLDEPTLGLDVETTFHMRRWLREHVAKHQIFALVTSHDMRFIESICDRVIIIKNGSIVTQGTVAELRASFAKRLFEITLKTPLTPAQEAELSARNIDVRVFPEAACTRLHLLLTESEKLYSFFDVLSRERQEIISITTDESDLEEIFLSLVQEQKVHEQKADGQNVDGQRSHS